MNTVTSILRGPIAAGILFPNIWLVVALMLLKSFDVWSTNYIVGRKGGAESPRTLTYRLIAWFGLRVGLIVDFALVAAIAWALYPYLFGLAAVLVIQLWITTYQWREFKKSQGGA